MPKLISILIPAYNAEKWIRFTINSALSQTWPKKEIIIVDDGSSDNTLQIAKQFESKSVKVKTQENSGASNARNKALSFAQGEYIQWLDADDLLAPDKIEKQLEKGDITPDSMILLSSCYANFYYRYHKATFVPNSLWQDLTPVEWLLTKFTENIWMNPAVWLVTRRLTELAGPWDDRLSLDDDGEYFCRVVAASVKVKFIPEARIYYRLANARSLSRATSYKACESLLLSLSLSFRHLLSLESSQRTRDACLEYLARWFHYFYPEKKQLVHKVHDLASSLGGTVPGPSLPLKYRLLSRLFGWQVAKEAMSWVSDSKLLLRSQYDWILSKFSKNASYPARLNSESKVSSL